MIRSTTGDLLRSDAEALVNTVNCVGVMGKGLALDFKRAYPEMFAEYRRACEAGEVTPGRIHVWETGRLVGPRYVLNFPTKRHWRSSSRLEDIEQGLATLATMVQEIGLRSIAIPPLGCGHGGLAWRQVRPLIVEALGTLEAVDVQLFEPRSVEGRTSQGVLCTSEERGLTNETAAMLELMGRYRAVEYSLSMLEAQKLAYFLQAAGLSLELEFRRHRYGPYAEGLPQALAAFLEFETSHRRPEAEVAIEAETLRRARDLLDRSVATVEAIDRVTRLIEGYETPYGMELLASAHWVIARDHDAAHDPVACTRALHAWSPRKRRVLRPAHIQVAWKTLEETDWLPRAA